LKLIANLSAFASLVLIPTPTVSHVSGLLSIYLMQLVQEWMRPARGNFTCPLRIGSDTIPPMGLRLRIALLLPFAALLGCGSSNSSGSSSSSGSTGSSGSSSTTNLSGYWVADATNSPGYPSYESAFSGELQFSNGAVTGTLATATFIPDLPNAPQECPATAQNVAVTGTIDASGNLTINVPLGGSYGTAVITAAIPANPQTLATGSYVVTGGSCATSATPITIAQYAPVTGTYTGTFDVYGTSYYPIPGETITITAVLTQSTTLDSNGQFRLTGTVTATGYCTASFFGVGFAAEGQVYLQGTNNDFVGTANPAATTIGGLLGGCSVGPNDGTLTRQ
jgi:hypothetical protein